MAITNLLTPRRKTKQANKKPPLDRRYVGGYDEIGKHNDFPNHRCRRLAGSSPAIPKVSSIKGRFTNPTLRTRRVVLLTPLVAEAARLNKKRLVRRIGLVEPN